MSEDAVEDGGGGSGKVLLILGLIIGVGVGGGAGFFLSGNDGGGTSEETVKKEEAKPKGDLLPIDIEKLTVPIYSLRNGSRRFIGNFFVDVRLQVYGVENQITVKRATTQLQHAFLTVMSRADFMKEGSSSEVDFDKVAKILRMKADEVLGNGIVEDVSIVKSVRMSR